ncbi:MAG: hypothetical protein MZU91_01780 [Desulfosudis oleivorans]|nr:hypothetical protein [Desulfosudis oleivorans]
MTVPAASVITAMGARSDIRPRGGARKLRQVSPMLMAGDVKGPRRILEAIHEGHRAGNMI